MRKIIFNILLVFSLIILTNCNDSEKLVVTLEIEDDIDIKEITLKSRSSASKIATDRILGNKIENRKEIKLQTPHEGEGTFVICIFTQKDTLCSQEYYIEGGYRPKLRLKNNKFQTITSLF